ncbi:hypothetical protein [Achromobacter marplatensis]
MADLPVAVGTGIAIGVVAVGILLITVNALGLTFGQRCAIEALPNESVQACVQRLRAATDNKEQ